MRDWYRVAIQVKDDSELFEIADAAPVNAIFRIVDVQLGQSPILAGTKNPAPFYLIRLFYEFEIVYGAPTTSVRRYAIFPFKQSDKIRPEYEYLGTVMQPIFQNTPQGLIPVDQRPLSIYEVPMILS